MSETFFVKQHKKEKFTILDNTCIRDSRLSWKSKGLHTYLMALPEDWKIYISDLITRSSDGRDSLNTAIKELEEFGYLKRNFERTENGRFKQFCYVVFESPITDIPFTENPLLEKPFTENPHLLTTKKLNTNKIKTELTNFENNKVNETVFVKKIRELFEGEYPFDSNFEESVKTFISKNEICNDNIESYLDYVFKRTCMCEIQKSFEGLYRKLALSKSILIDFKKSFVIQNNEKLDNEKELKPVVKLFTCPICNIEFDEFQYYCPQCNLDGKSIEENNEMEIKIARALLKMNDEERDKLEMAMDKKLKSIGRLFFIKNEKEEFYREYGLIN